ncbi:MAG TPA: hypothetical protein VIF60_00845 [Burkholderiaceae bacterium]
MSGVCRANGCSTPAQSMLMMCSSHWRMLPSALQRTLRRSQQECAGSESDPALVPYLDACAQAVEFVAMREMRKPDNRYRQALAMLEADLLGGHEHG